MQYFCSSSNPSPIMNLQESTSIGRFCKEDCKSILTVLGIIILCIPTSLFVTYVIKKSFLSGPRQNSTQNYVSSYENRKLQYIASEELIKKRFTYILEKKLL